MENFKFINREEELNYAKNAILVNNFVIYYHYNNSGLTHYLKKLQVDLTLEKNICFYVDCESSKEIANQMSEQIISGCNQTDLIKKTKWKKKGEVAKRIIKSIATSLDFIPFVNLGEIATTLMESIIDTIDVDIEHVPDYKIGKAIVKMFATLEKSHKYNSICILIDNANSISYDSLGFVTKLMNNNFVKIIFTVPNNSFSAGIEYLSKLSCVNFSPYEIENTFCRPNNNLIRGLFNCYQKNFKEEYINIFEEHERNIHVIMSYIRGFNLNFSKLSEDKLRILKILMISNTGLNTNLLQKIYFKNRFFVSENNFFEHLIKNLEELSFIYTDVNNTIFHNKKLITFSEIPITLIEKITITNNILDVFDDYVDTLDVSQLKFAVGNLDKDYSRRKRYLLVLLEKQKIKGEIEQQYLDMLFYLTNKQDLLNVCGMYYNLQVYDVPYYRMMQHHSILEGRECKVLMALLKERLHKDNYSDDLFELVNSSDNIDEKCLLVAVLFTAWFNIGDSKRSMQILENKSSKIYYKKFSSSKFYCFLLRNISYYINDVDLAINNYKYCLSKFINSDPVNYNRTMCNFIGYLMKKNSSQIAQSTLSEIIPEVKGILDFNDSKYLYLNINYGLYLMNIKNENPTDYFNSIIYESGTTETPYIYSKINLALYIARNNPMESLSMLDEIFHNHIAHSTVVPTIIFYKINRILVEYMNGIFDKELLMEIKQNPLRGDKKYANSLYHFYLFRFEHNIGYSSDDWSRLFLPGYIFYHGFDAEVVFSTFDNPNSTI